MLIVCEHFCISRENPRQITQSCSAVAQCSLSNTQCSLPGPNCATRPSARASSPRKETPSHSYTSRWQKIHSNTSKELLLLLLLLLLLILLLLLFSSESSDRPRDWNWRFQSCLKPQSARWVPPGGNCKSSIFIGENFVAICQRPYYLTLILQFEARKALVTVLYGKQ